RGWLGRRRPRRPGRLCERPGRACRRPHRLRRHRAALVTVANLRPALARLMQAGLLVVLCVLCGMAAANPMADGRARSQSFLDGDTGSIWSQMDAQMQDALGSEDALKQ